LFIFVKLEYTALMFFSEQMFVFYSGFITAVENDKMPSITHSYLK